MDCKCAYLLSEDILSVIRDGSSDEVSALISYLIPSEKEMFRFFCAAIELNRTDLIKPMLQYDSRFLDVHTAPPDYDYDWFYLRRKPIHIAASRNHAELVKLLVEYGADQNSTAECKNTPLILAAREGHFATVKILTELGVDVNNPNAAGETALHVAAMSNYTKILKLLLKCGANINLKTREGYTLLDLALYFQHPHVIKILLKSGVNVNNHSGRLGSPLYYATLKNDKRTVKFLLKMGANTECVGISVATSLPLLGSSDVTPLLIAAHKGYLKIVHVLLNAGANINIEDSEGNTPLSVAAAEHDQDEIVRLLLGKGIKNVDAGDIWGQKALHVYSQRNKLGIVKSLLKHGAKIDSNDFSGRTALHLAANRGHLKIVKWLLEHKASVNLPSPESGCTPLLDSISRMRCVFEVVKVLIDFGADVNFADDEGTTALHRAMNCLMGDISKTVQLLLQHGAKVNSKDGSGKTPLHLFVTKYARSIAANFDDNKTVELLLKFGANINLKDESGVTPLQEAFWRTTNLEAFQTFLQYGPADGLLRETHLLDLLNRALRYISLPHNSESQIIHSKTSAIIDHIKKMKAAKLFTANIDFLVGVPADVTLVSDPETRCLEEIERMKLKNVGGSHTSFYEILSSGIDELARLARNERIARFMKNVLLPETEFPLYAVYLRSQFEKAKMRHDILDAGIKFCHSLFIQFSEMPYPLTEKIVGMLTNEDLRIFTTCINFKAREK